MRRPYPRTRQEKTRGKKKGSDKLVAGVRRQGTVASEQKPEWRGNITYSNVNFVPNETDCSIKNGKQTSLTTLSTHTATLFTMGIRHCEKRKRTHRIEPSISTPQGQQFNPYTKRARRDTISENNTRNCIFSHVLVFQGPDCRRPGAA